MKLASYAEFGTKKRAMTFGLIGFIGAAHLLVLGGGYFVARSGSSLEEGQPALAGANGLGTWSSQSANASEPTVRDGSSSLVDARAANLSGYNAGETLYAGVLASAAASEGKGARFAPQRPSGSSSTPSSAPASSGPNSSRDSDDEVLRPLNNPSSYPSPSSIRSTSEPGSTIEYKVQAGDSLWAIAKRYNVTVAEVAAANPSIKANSIKVGQMINVPRQSSGAFAAPTTSAPIAERPAVVNGSEYVVKGGDSLSRIASRQGVTVPELRVANGLTNDNIRIGQKLVIPGVSKKPELASRQHSGQKAVIEPGDTLEKIAGTYGVSVRELQDFNNIRDPRSIRAGQTLLIPERPTATTAAGEPKRLPTRAATPPPVEEKPLQTLDTLKEAPASPAPLPTLDEAFQADDLEEQPLVPILE